jgi:hypothetical protein
MKDFNFYLKWAATFLTLAFAVMTSMRLTPYNIWIANISSLMWLIWSLRVKEWSLVVVNTGLLLVYAAGLFI